MTVIKRQIQVSNCSGFNFLFCSDLFGMNMRQLVVLDDDEIRFSVLCVSFTVNSNQTCEMWNQTCRVWNQSVGCAIKSAWCCPKSVCCETESVCSGSKSA